MTAIRRRQEWVREEFWKLVGGKPERTPLNARVTGEFTRQGYQVRKLVYESQPGIVVSANLYIPAAGQPPYPGVLFQMGHAGNGKAYPSYQKCCQSLARLGYLVLAFDPMGQGERINYPDSSGTKTRLSSVDEEHTLPGKQFLLLGNSATRYQVWDAIRGLDYLAGHPLADAGRLAATGQSGGATLTMLLACVDSRLAAVAVSSGNTENFATAKFQAPGSTDDAEQELIGSGILGFDRWDLLYPFAPKPLLIQVSAHDFFGTYSPRYLDDGREQYEKLSGVYEICGRRDQLSWNSTPLTHGLTYSLRLGIYQWFEKWLMKSARGIDEEPPVPPETEQTLWSGPTGNVNRDFASLRPFGWVKHEASVINRAGSAMSWKKTLPYKLPASSLKLRVLSEVSLSDARLAAAEVNSSREVWIPLWLLIPAQPDRSRLPLLILDELGRNSGVAEDGLYHRLATAGRTVWAADIRGVGDSRPDVGPGNPAYTVEHAAEDEYAWASLILGEPLLAQRITDILALAQAISNQASDGRGKVALAARGALTVPALFACAAAPQNIASLYLAGGLISFKNLLETENYRQPLANFAWNLYRSTDLPLLAAECSPRVIQIGGARDASNRPLSVAEVQRIYAENDAGNVHVQSEAAWDETFLGSL
jgi:dienelactone hydrolase